MSLLYFIPGILIPHNNESRLNSRLYSQAVYGRCTGTPGKTHSKAITARLLMRAVVTAEGVSFDSESCPPRLNVGRFSKLLQHDAQSVVTCLEHEEWSAAAPFHSSHR